MTVTLHLGVNDIPYVNDEAKTAEPVRKGKKRGGSRWRRSDLVGGSVSTTGDVAQILEDKYHVMEIFVAEHMDDVILPAVANAAAGALETALMGGPAQDVNYAGATSAIEASFKQFLSNKEIEMLGYPGVPTKAALRGVNHRMAHPYAKRGPRPSFIDSGLYQANFRAWV